MTKYLEEKRRRASAALYADHAPRTFERGGIRAEREPKRISRADEQDITDEVRLREGEIRQAARAALAASTTETLNRVQALRGAMHTDATRTERQIARRVAHDLEVLGRMLEVTPSRGVH
jgi:hypothetical protein